jgi:hypothetical protein
MSINPQSPPSYEELFNKIYISEISSSVSYSAEPPQYENIPQSTRIPRYVDLSPLPPRYANISQPDSNIPLSNTNMPHSNPNIELKFAPSQIGALPICSQAHQTNQKHPLPSCNTEENHISATVMNWP